MDGPELFGKWLEKEGISLAECARRMGVTPPAAQGWRAGKYRPEAVERAKLARLSSGAVPESSWFSKDELRAIEEMRPYEREDSPAATEAAQP